MKLDKCDKCDTEISYNNGTYFKTNNGNTYPICNKCYDEWYNNGYWDIWFGFYHAYNIDLADKFILDYLGKLG